MRDNRVEFRSVAFVFCKNHIIMDIKIKICLLDKNYVSFHLQTLDMWQVKLSMMLEKNHVFFIYGL